MATRLLSCPACARHVRVDEARCPFCDAELPDEFGTAPVPLPPPPGLGRAALARYGSLRIAVGGAGMLAAAAALSVACDSGTASVPAYGSPGGPGVGFVGPDHHEVDWGTDCEEEVYYPYEGGWAICYDGSWGYTTTNPDGLSGYKEWDGAVGDTGSSSDASGPTDADE